MTLRNFAGYSIIAAIFIALAVFIFVEAGAMVVLVGFGGTAALCGLIILAINLINS